MKNVTWNDVMEEIARKSRGREGLASEILRDESRKNIILFVLVLILALSNMVLYSKIKGEGECITKRS